MRWINRFCDQANKEPIALLALTLAVLGFLFEREFFQRWLQVEPTINAYHVEQADGRCPMVAFEVDNTGNQVIHNIRISIVEDWITSRGHDDLMLLTFEDSLIGPREEIVMDRRETMDVETEIFGNTFSIPMLQPSQYVQRILPRSISPHMTTARNKLASNPEHRVLPKIGHATYEGGQILVNRNGSCLD